jgi:organic hydroperoxide reductase OsmC/OhrA
MIKYPISFFAKTYSPQGMNSAWNFENQNITSPCSIPPEFDGPGGGLSPEDLYVQALTSCFVATFKVYAEKSKVSFSRVSVNSELIVDLNEEKKPVMKKCQLNVLLSGCSNGERAKALAEKAFQAGFILNSVKTELALNLRID